MKVFCEGGISRLWQHTKDEDTLKPSTKNSIKALGGYEEIKEMLDEWRFN